MPTAKGIRLHPNQQLLERQLSDTCIPAMTKVWDRLQEENHTIFKYNNELNIITMTQVIISYSAHGNISYQKLCSTLGLNSVGSTICKKRRKIRGDMFKELYRLTMNELSSLFSTNVIENFEHVYAIDGSYLTCRTHNPQEPEVGLLLSMMYDVQNLIPIDFVLLPSYNERVAIFDHHIKRIPPNM